MLLDEIQPELREVLSDPQLRIEPEGLSESERQRWENWRQSGGANAVPSPAEIDAAARLIREAGLRSEGVWWFDSRFGW